LFAKPEKITRPAKVVIQKEQHFSHLKSPRLPEHVIPGFVKLPPSGDGSSYLEKTPPFPLGTSNR
jgi:hypothetical protein